MGLNTPDGPESATQDTRVGRSGGYGSHPAPAAHTTASRHRRTAVWPTYSSIMPAKPP